MRYEAPETVEKAAALLADSTGETRVLAGGTDLLVQEAAAAIVGSRLDRPAQDRLEAAARAACVPIDDKRGTVEFRIQVAGVLARRAALIALDRARTR